MSHYGRLAIYIKKKKYLKAKERIMMKTQIFHQKNPLKETKILQDIIIKLDN